MKIAMTDKERYIHTRFIELFLLNRTAAQCTKKIYQLKNERK